MKKVRKHIIFYGRIQGVGFRYTACYLARPLGLTGWVKNLWDGSVEMEVQGPESDIETMLKRLQNGRFIQIDRMDIQEIPMRSEHDFVEVWD